MTSDNVTTDSNNVERLVEQHIDIVPGVLQSFRYTSRVIQDDIESAGMQALLHAAMHYLHEGDARPFRPYAVTAIRRAMLDVVRARKRYTNHLAEYYATLPHYHDSVPRLIIPDASEELARHMDNRLIREKLEDAISRLSPDQQMIIKMHYFEGVGLDDLARGVIDGHPRAIGTVKASAYRARRRLASDPELRAFYERNFLDNKRAA